MKLATLKAKAREAATWRGHHLGNFIASKDGTKARAECKRCKCSVGVNTHPLPNEIDIAGEAIAINCRNGE